MKPSRSNRIFHFILISTAFIFQNNECNAQNSSNSNNTFHKENMDSLIKVTTKMVEDAVREHQLHKDNKDSAWINDWNYHVVWDSRSKSKDGKTITIIDSTTHCYYILDSTHTTIRAYSKSKNISWETDPRSDNSMPEYRHKNPTIVYFKIEKIPTDNYFEKFKKEERVIYIRYH